MVEYMKKLGFTEYEIKAYFTLLEHHPVNGYSLSKQSKIPRSRIYEVVESLIQKSAAFEHIENDQRLFTPLEPRLLFMKLKDEYALMIDELNDYAEQIYNTKHEEYEQKIIKGRGDIIAFINLILKDANDRIAFSIWDEELHELLPMVEEKIKDGVSVRGVYFGQNSPIETLVAHRRIERYVAEKKDRYIIVVVDNSHVISGVISKKGTSRVTWTQEPGEIDIKDDFIAHDVMINSYSYQIDDHKYEKALDLIRKDYFCYDDDEYESFKDK
ncbi:TrmB family transcriptional regulator [Acidaminobacter sp. JC074]|uniref:TrmB family transcriptional regulator n=1 Tax=Acidaminobacter sp. JC074 TaxID=2530199 RepID=UPI001F0D9684|nr:helix-turn-helix domain-containing protein [Acidaminobacter sp. JC074]MCH4890813.1 TrmB family transcriptional regulator [Acidaminobacter sp. JC074]